MNAWLTEDGRKAIEVMGWPEWKDENGCKTSLISRDDGVYNWRFSGAGSSRRAMEQEAIALLRDHAREWLDKHDVFIERTRPNCSWTWKRWSAWHMAATGEVTRDTYDEILIAAVLAVGGGK